MSNSKGHRNVKNTLFNSTLAREERVRQMWVSHNFLVYLSHQRLARYNFFIEDPSAMYTWRNKAIRICFAISFINSSISISSIGYCQHFVAFLENEAEIDISRLASLSLSFWTVCVPTLKTIIALLVSDVCSKSTSKTCLILGS